MARKPALSLAAVPGRRSATPELAQRIEKEGYAGIYCPSMNDGLALLRGARPGDEDHPLRHQHRQHLHPSRL